MIFLDGISQFAHNTALSVAAMCGNSGAPPTDAPSNFFLPNLQPTSHLSGLDTDYDLLDGEELHLEPTNIADPEITRAFDDSYLSFQPDATHPSRTAQSPPQSKVSHRPDFNPAASQITADFVNRSSEGVGLNGAQQALVEGSCSAFAGSYIFFGSVSELIYKTTTRAAAKHENFAGVDSKISDNALLTKPQGILQPPSVPSASAAFENDVPTAREPWSDIVADGEVGEALHADLSEIQDTPLARGGLTISGGYSSVEGPNVEARISRRNIGGRNREFAAAARYSKIQTHFELGYADGNFLGGKTIFAPTLFANRLSATGFGNNIQSTPFKQSARGFNLHLNRKFADGLSATVNYRLSDDSFRMRVKNSACDNSIFGSPICGALGDTTSSILSMALTLDQRVTTARATKGVRLRVTQDIGVGGTARYTRTRIGGEAHIGIGSKMTLSLDAEGGFMAPIGKGIIPLFDRFYIGDNSMRGFDLRGLGPKVRPSAAGPDQNIAIGGRTYYAARAELSVQIGGALGERGLQASAFVDAGSVFGARSAGLLPGETLLGNSAKPRVAVGLGLALNTPVGRLRLDFARPVVKQAGDRTKLLSISFGAAI